MFTLPTLISLPSIGFFGAGGFDVPAAGAMVGWFLIAALVGSALGILRRMGREETPATPRSNATMISLRVAHPVDVRHKEAA